MDNPKATDALSNPANRRLLAFALGTLLLLALAFALWRGSGERSAKRDLENATERVVEKQKEVDEARRLYEQRIAELRALRADVDVERTRTGAIIDAETREAVANATPDAAVLPPGVTVTDDAGDVDEPAVYYVRDRKGRYHRVTRP